MRNSCSSAPVSCLPRPTRSVTGLVFAASLLAASSLAGCSGDSDVERGAHRFFDDVGHGVLGHQSSSEQVVVPVSGVVNVEVHNFAGDVFVRGDRSDRAADALVIFDRRGVHGGPRDVESEQSLPDIHWDTELVPAAAPDQAPTLKITSRTEHAEPWFQRLEIEVLVAQLGRVDVITKRGRVQVSNNQGPVDLTTSKGDVRVITTWPQKRDSVIITSEGDIDFRVRGESGFVLDAETVGGLVKTRCDAGRWTAVDARNDHDSMFATLNGGDGRVVLRTTDGNIRVAVVGDPHSVGSFPIAP